MKLLSVLTGLFTFIAFPAFAQNVSDAFDPSYSLQSWQDPQLAKVRANCRNPAPVFVIPAREPQSGAMEAPAMEVIPTSSSIPNVVGADQEWELVWSWNGNQADGHIATEDGGLMFANNDASNVIRLNLDGSAEIVYENTNTGGALSRSKNGDLFLLNRGLNSSIVKLEPERHILADKINGDPLDCLSGIMNDLVADSLGGVYFTISRAGFFYADADGIVTQYGDDVIATNGVILSPDEDKVYVTNGPVVVAFDVESNGSLSNQRDFGRLSVGNGDGMAIDAEGRVYVSTGSSVNVFSPNGDFLGNIAGPRGLHGVAFSGEDKHYIYAIVLNNNFAPNTRHRIFRMPMLAQGYLGRAK
ncbi:MAG: SMP-30/gluconolactonase/LRE family protein [Gammaproteobacteria bacterium]|jgi:gluconolactonase|nr:SMP-30/gluconolactonase/LRE family protein [Gammaproteobacteria bacterium]